jgi:hypothetical protein
VSADDIRARLAAITYPPCPRCGRPTTPSEYCAATDGGGCIRYGSVYLTPDDVAGAAQ